jgi:hypothetical protein
MNYSVEQASLLARQLEGLATRYAHQVAGQFANLEFWLDEVAHVVATINDYPRRFRQLREAQAAWVQAHDTKLTPRCGICRGPCEFGAEPPPAPSRIPSEELSAARTAVQRACYRFLLRLYRIGVLAPDALQDACDRIDVTLEREDLADA